MKGEVKKGGSWRRGLVKGEWKGDVGNKNQKMDLI